MHKISIQERTKSETLAYYDGMVNGLKLLESAAGSTGYVRYWRIREFLDLARKLRADFEEDVK